MQNSKLQFKIKNFSITFNFKLLTLNLPFGFTLVELLVVVSILSLLGLVSYANLRNFRSGQVIEKAASDLQTFMRLAQSNATSRLNCDGQAGATWLVGFNLDRQTIDLRCYVDDPGTASNQGNALSFSGTNIQVDTIDRRGLSPCSGTLPVTIGFAPLYGTVNFADTNAANDCMEETTTEVAIILTDTQRNTSKAVVIKKGGGIDVELAAVLPPPTPASTPTPTPVPTPTPTPVPTPAFNYSLAANSASVSVTQGSSAANTITRTLVAGTTQAVTLSANALPGASTPTFTTNPCNPTCSSTINTPTSASTPVGNHTVTVTGSPLNRTTQFTVNVTAAPLSSISADSGSSPSSNFTPSGSSISWNHTTGNCNNRMLVVGVASRRGSSGMTSVTYGGVALSNIRSDTAGTDVRSELWYRINPPSGTFAIQVNASNPTDSIVAGASSWCNVHQTSPIRSAAGTFNTSAGTSASVNVPSNSQDIVLDAIATQSVGATVSVGPGQTQLWNRQGTWNNGAASSETGSSSVTMSWTLAGSEFWAISAASFQRAP